MIQLSEKWYAHLLGVRKASIRIAAAGFLTKTSSR